VEVARLLGVPLERVQALPSGVELELFQRRALGRRERLLHWRRWLVEEPLGWDESGTPGTVAYREAALWPFREAEAIPCAGAAALNRVGEWARLPLGGLAIVEACCFVGAAGGGAGAVRMSAGAR
jgi:hypothetical protein